MGGIYDVSSRNIVLGNGDTFGFAYNQYSGDCSALQAFTFDVIPEPATVSMFAAAGADTLWIRRRLLK